MYRKGEFQLENLFSVFFDMLDKIINFKFIINLSPFLKSQKV